VYAPRVAPKCLDQRERFALRQRLAAGKDDHGAIPAGFSHARDDLIDGCKKLQRVIGVAEITREIASG